MTEKVCLERILQDSCKKYIFSVRFLQEMYFLPESCKICIFVRIVFIFNQGMIKSQQKIEIEKEEKHRRDDMWRLASSRNVEWSEEGATT